MLLRRQNRRPHFRKSRPATVKGASLTTGHARRAGKRRHRPGGIRRLMSRLNQARSRPSYAAGSLRLSGGLASVTFMPVDTNETSEADRRRVNWARTQTEKPLHNRGFFMGGTGLEPVTPSLSRWCSSCRLRGCDHDRAGALHCMNPMRPTKCTSAWMRSTLICACMSSSTGSRTSSPSLGRRRGTKLIRSTRVVSALTGQRPRSSGRQGNSWSSACRSSLSTDSFEEFTRAAQMIEPPA